MEDSEGRVGWDGLGSRPAELGAGSWEKGSKEDRDDMTTPSPCLDLWSTLFDMALPPLLSGEHSLSSRKAGGSIRGQHWVTRS